MEMYQINGRNVSLQFKNKKVLKDISFQLDGNKIYGLLGRNGACYIITFMEYGW